MRVFKTRLPSIGTVSPHHTLQAFRNSDAQTIKVLLNFATPLPGTVSAPARRHHQSIMDYDEAVAIYNQLRSSQPVKSIVASWHFLVHALESTLFYTTLTLLAAGNMVVKKLFRREDSKNSLSKETPAKVESVRAGAQVALSSTSGPSTAPWRPPPRYTSRGFNRSPNNNQYNNRRGSYSPCEPYRAAKSYLGPPVHPSLQTTANKAQYVLWTKADSGDGKKWCSLVVRIDDSEIIAKIRSLQNKIINMEPRMESYLVPVENLRVKLLQVRLAGDDDGTQAELLESLVESTLQSLLADETEHHFELKGMGFDTNRTLFACVCSTTHEASMLYKLIDQLKRVLVEHQFIFTELQAPSGPLYWLRACLPLIEVNGAADFATQQSAWKLFKQVHDARYYFGSQIIDSIMIEQK